MIPSATARNRTDWGASFCVEVMCKTHANKKRMFSLFTMEGVDVCAATGKTTPAASGGRSLLLSFALSAGFVLDCLDNFLMHGKSKFTESRPSYGVPSADLIIHNSF